MKNWKHMAFQLTLMTIIVVLAGYAWQLNKQLSALHTENADLKNVLVNVMYTSALPTPEIPSPTPPHTCSYPPLMDWNLYEEKSLDVIYHGESGDELHHPDTSPLSREKAYVRFEGRKYSARGPARNVFDHAIFVFSQNGESYDFSVSNRVENDLALVDMGTEITIFIDKLWHASRDNPFIGEFEHIVQDYAEGKTIAAMPDLHWNAAVVQNGNLWIEDDVYIEKQPFTLNTYLPRRHDVKTSVKVSVSASPQEQSFIGIDLKEKCASESVFAPVHPFCDAHSVVEYANNDGRDLFVSRWISHTFWYQDCHESALNKVEFSESTGVFERDALYLQINENGSDGVLTDRVTIPVSDFAGDTLFLTFFYDLNENEIIDSNEIKTRILHFE